MQRKLGCEWTVTHPKAAKIQPHGALKSGFILFCSLWKRHPRGPPCGKAVSPEVPIHPSAQCRQRLPPRPQTALRFHRNRLHSPSLSLACALLSLHSLQLVPVVPVPDKPKVLWQAKGKEGCENLQMHFSGLCHMSLCFEIAFF